VIIDLLELLVVDRVEVERERELEIELVWLLLPLLLLLECEDVLVFGRIDVVLVDVVLDVIIGVLYI